MGRPVGRGPGHLDAAEPYAGPAALLSLFARALRLSPSVFREVAGRPEATKLSLAVAAIAGAVGLASQPVVGPGLRLVLPLAIALGMGLTLAVVAVETTIAWGVCRLVFAKPPSFGRALRPLAAAHAPRILFVGVPAVAGLGAGAEAILGLVVWIWLLAAFVVALQAATERGWPGALALAIVLLAIPWLFDLAIGRL